MRKSDRLVCLVLMTLFFSWFLLVGDVSKEIRRKIELEPEDINYSVTFIAGNRGVSDARNCRSREARFYMLNRFLIS